MKQEISHLTINTNQVWIAARADISAEKIEGLQSLTQDSANKALKIPGLPLHARVRRDDVLGLAELDVWSQKKVQVAILMVVWTKEAEEKVWPQIVTQSRQAGIIALLLNKPKEVPWLAVALTPAAAVLSDQTIACFGDFERSWAWAVLESVEGHLGRVL